MSRVCVPGLLALLAAVPHVLRGGDQVDWFGGGRIEIKVEIKKLPAEAQAELNAMAIEVQEREAPLREQLDVRFDIERMVPAVLPGFGNLVAMQVVDEFVAGGGVELVIGGDEAVEAPDEEEETKPRELSAAEKKTLETFVKKATEERRKQLTTDMEQVAEAEEKEAKLDKAAVKALKALTAKSVDAAIPAWEKEFRKYIQPLVERLDDATVGMSTWSAEAYSRNVPLTAAPPPQESDLWKSGLKEILTAGQWTAREEAQKAEEKKFQEDMGDYLATCEGQAGDQMAAVMDSTINRILQFGDIDEERRKKLKAAADEAVKQTVKEWRQRTEKQLRTMGKEQREQMTNRGGVMGVNVSEKENQPQEKPVWKEALAQILTDAERKVIDDRRMEVRGRRAEALALILVADLDRLIGFSDKQRAEFLALSSKRMLKLPETYFTSPENGGYYSLDPGQMLSQVKGLKNDQVSAILDEGQMKRWKSTSTDQLARNGSYTRSKLEVIEMPKPEDMDEAEVERLLSTFMHREARKSKLKMLSQMEAQVEQIRRVVNPSPEVVAVLTTAAKGAAEEMAVGSIANFTQWLRGQVQNVKPSEVPGRLQSLYNPYFSERTQVAPPQLWTAAVERLLNSEQRTLWKKELDAREAWRRKGLSAMVITDLEKRLILKPEQRENLLKKVAEVIEQYEPDFSNYFSFGWHLQGYYAMIPIAMFTDKEMGEHFDKKQIETVKEKCLQNASQYAEMIRRQHKSRTNK